MKKLVIASLVALAAVLFGFSNTSLAVDRPNTPECADVNGRSDPDACHIQYIEPLQKELEELWFQLVKLQGKKPEDNPWVFQTDNSACDQDKPEYYNEKTCKLSMPGKLAQAKYIIREEINKTAYQAKTKQQKARLVQKLTAAKKELAEKDKELAEANERTEKFFQANISLAKDVETWKKFADDRTRQMENFRLLFLIFLVTTVLAVLGLIVVKRL